MASTILSDSFQTTSEIDVEMFGPLILCNIPPSAAEKAALEDALAPHLAEAARLEEEIAKLERLLREEQRIVRGYNRIFAPARRLPPEIVAEIFLHTAPVCAAPPSAADTSPLVLAAICAAWRNVALTTAPLWSHFVFDFRSSATERAFDTVAGEWLARAAGIALDARLVFPRSCDGYDGPSLAPYAGLLTSYIKRCRALALSPPADTTDIQRFIEPDSLFPLQELHLSLKHQITDTGLFEIFSRAPRLQDVTIKHAEGSSIIFPFRPTLLPCSQLTRLVLVHVHVDIDAGLSLLGLCVNLVVCDVCCWGDIPTTSTAITNRSLQELHFLIGPASESLAAFFRCLTLPSLTTLTVSGAHGDMYELLVDALAAPGDRGFLLPRLGHLTMTGCSAAEGAVIQTALQQRWRRCGAHVQCTPPALDVTVAFADEYAPYFRGHFCRVTMAAGQGDADADA